MRGSSPATTSPGFTPCATSRLATRAESACICAKLTLRWQGVVAIPVEERLPHVTVGIISRRDALNTAECDYLIDCFAEAVSALASFEGV
ncbi:MAG TPA: hypothetical protein VMV45_07095 [Casimicrobiaceae bacterium]|nr:hypothetical protein [Casimicrobiaceae bacterium]